MGTDHFIQALNVKKKNSWLCLCVSIIKTYVITSWWRQIPIWSGLWPYMHCVCRSLKTLRRDHLINVLMPFSFYAFVCFVITQTPMRQKAFLAVLWPITVCAPETESALTTEHKMPNVIANVHMWPFTSKLQSFRTALTPPSSHKPSVMSSDSWGFQSNSESDRKDLHNAPHQQQRPVGKQHARGRNFNSRTHDPLIFH